MSAACNGSANEHGFAFDATTGAITGPPAPGGGGPRCITTASGSDELRLAPCDGSEAQRFKFAVSAGDCAATGAAACGEITAADQQCLDIWCGSGAPCGPALQLNPCHQGPNQRFAFVDGALRAETGQCITATSTPPPGPADLPTARLMLWAKPQPNGAQAVFLLSNQDGDATEAVTIKLANLNITTPSVRVRDVWEHRDLGTATGSFTTDAIGGHDSRFYIFSPV